MNNRHNFLYGRPMLGHSPFQAMNERGLLGQGTPAAAPQTVVVQAPGGASAPPLAQAQSSGVPMLGVLIVVGAVLVGLEVGGVIDIFGLDKLERNSGGKKADAKKV